MTIETSTPAAPAVEAPAAELGAEILRAIGSSPTRDDWLAYEAAKRQFAERCPGATADEQEAFARRLSRELNL